MHSILGKLKKLQLKARRHPEPTYHPAWPLCDEEISRPDMEPQHGSPLFGTLSAELRIMIYRAVLTDASRFLHICLNRRDGVRRRVRSVAHYWCVDMESQFPKWQHTCYGEKFSPPGQEFRPITETDDKLLSLLLTCRIIYAEAMPILYRENVFHFRGGPPLLAFRASISPRQWSSIRHIHISSIHTKDSCMPGAEKKWPPEHIETWDRCFEILRGDKTLETLRIDLMARFDMWGGGSAHNTELILMEALRKMRSIPAKFYEVEINIDPPQEFWDALGEVDFAVIVRERQYNETLYYHPTSLQF
ncbi:hypothetical protein K491DRAFT_680773 [Lophiostoma macrostomum CBS 122681]|uniref:DUF7730 domain-containing protein n=1 Tax=Lophiostoma macrostomum CBS 122681 TaxID=1314788 RepID=A0A6A6SZM6_9PLEO|nr:hypothetical protein K491DRAFT_680773 [Lophiostoma macrostomum CBS 122681]